MKQIVQDFKSGQTILEEVPVPQVRPGCLLIKTHCILVSHGTERILLEFGKAGWISNARKKQKKMILYVNSTLSIDDFNLL